jgi:alpha/beta hydrolase fold
VSRCKTRVTRGAEAHPYDARGFGQSPAPKVTFSLLADLITVFDQYGLDCAAIVGCSQGGGSALGLALDQPTRVSALVLLCPGIPGYPWPEEPDEDEAEYEHALRAGDVDGVAGLLQRVWAAAGPTPAVMEQLRSAARAEISSGDLQQRDPPVFDRLGEISVPTSLLVGDADYPPLIEADAGRGPDPRMPADPGAGAGSPAAPACAGPRAAHDREHPVPGRLVRHGPGGQLTRARGWPRRAPRHPARRPSVGDDLVAQVHALTADRHPGTGDQHLDLTLTLTAKTAREVVTIHRRYPFASSMPLPAYAPRPQAPAPS